MLLILIDQVKPRWQRHEVEGDLSMGGDAPIIIDRDGVIIDGHHRYYHAIDRGRLTIGAVRLPVTFDESEPLRQMDAALKRRELWDLHRLYKRALAILAQPSSAPAPACCERGVAVTTASSSA